MLKGFIKSETLEKLGFEKQGILYWKDLYAIEEDKVDTEQPIAFSFSDTEVFDYMTKDGLYLKAEWVQLDNISKALTVSKRFGGNLDKQSFFGQETVSNASKEKSERIEKLFENIRTCGIKIEDPHALNSRNLARVGNKKYIISVDKARKGNDDCTAVLTYIDYNNLYKKLGYPNSGEL